ncbi:MAG: DUF4339 domain-containing protein, partial [Gemmataceae bacterium]|nr:DUF4339 domain-containing protein [Gemmataceae bacterium]
DLPVCRAGRRTPADREVCRHEERPNAMQFYLLIDNQRKGPFTLEQLLTEGLERDSLVWHTGQADWVRADQLPALADLMLSIPPPAPRLPHPNARPLPGPPMELLDMPEPEVFASWVRYRPGVFRTLYFWFVGLISLALLLAVVTVVTAVLAANTRTNRLVRIVDQAGNFRGDRWVHDAAAVDYKQSMEVVAILAGLAGGIALIAGLVLSCVLYYKAWNQIQDGQARTSAGMAVGLLLVPFFNLYWVFVAVYGLAWDLHRYVVRRGWYTRPNLGPYPLSPGLALACSILFVASWVPVVNFAALPVALVMELVLMTSIKNASMEIAAARLEQPTWAPLVRPAPVGPPQVSSVPPSPPVGKSEHVRDIEAV